MQALHNQFLTDKPLYVTKMSQIHSLTGHLPFFSQGPSPSADWFGRFLRFCHREFDKDNHLGLCHDIFSDQRAEGLSLRAARDGVKPSL